MAPDSMRNLGFQEKEASIASNSQRPPTDDAGKG